MNNLGAIPKAQGARPKTKPIANGMITNPEYKASCRQKNKSINSYDGRSIDGYNKFSGGGTTTNGNLVPPLPDGSLPKPLEEREIQLSEEGVQIKRFALAPEWVEKRVFIHYTRPPLPSMGGDFVIGAIEAWVEQMGFLVADLKWLLNLPHYRFWSQMVYDRSVQECLEFYLTGGPRWYEDDLKDDVCLAVITEIHQLVFLIYVRMATFKESKDDHITPSVFGDLIYDNYLFDVCKILELCILYGSSNRPLLTKMIANVFEHQPKYFNDLAELVVSLKSVLENLEKKLGIFDLLAPRFAQCDVTLSLEELMDIVHYVMDTFCSVHAFVTVFPRACHTFHEKEFDLRLSLFYERAVPKLSQYLSPSEEVLEDEEEVFLRRDLLQKLSTVRVTALSVFREVLVWFAYGERSHKGQSVTSSELSKSIEHFTHMLTSCVEEKVFITDYNSMFFLGGDLEYFQAQGADMTPLNFVREAVESIVSEMDLPQDSPQEDRAAPHATDDTSGMNGYYAGETSSLSPVEIDSLVISVQELLPDLGAGFVRHCLKYYNYSSEEVLNAVLECNLPPCLDDMDRSLKEYVEEQPPPAPETPAKTSQHLADALDESSVLVNRLNIYDDDEFDVFRNPSQFQKNKFHKGKRKEEPRYEKDPDLVEKMKSIVTQYDSTHGYSIYEDETKYSPLASAEYEDEYDDTYDDNDAGDVDNFGNDKRRGRITMIGRGALNTPGMKFVEDGEEEEEEQEGGVGVGAGAAGGGEGVGGLTKQETEDAISNSNERRQNPQHRKSNSSTYRRGNSSYGRGKSADVWDSNPRHNQRNSKTGSRNDFRETNTGSRNDYRESNTGSRNDYRESNTGSRNDYRESNTGSYNNNFVYRSDFRSSSSYQASNPERRTYDNREPAPFVPFCENPELTRERYERKRMNKQFRNKGYCQQPIPNNGEGGPAPLSAPSARGSTRANKHSGKSWRQGASGEEADQGRTHGGKYKEDTNHGKAQDRSYRHKMVHKNEQRRNAAQFKYRGNF